MHDTDDLVQNLDPELPRGTVVGEYVIEAKIGSGTFGSVYRAIQPLIGKQVAVKILAQRYSSDPTVVSRFIAEARAVNQIRHKNIIDIFSFGQLPDGRHYHIMELLAGTTLDLYLRERGGRLPLVEVILILRPLARALDAAHASGIAHRDLKPANIFLARDDDGAPFPKLLDFGIAKLMTNELPRQHVTGTGVAVGTPDYMSPEQCQGPDVDHRTDVYAFGVMVFQLLTGRLPFIGANVVDVLVKQMTAIPVPPSSVCSSLPKTIDAPVLWMLEKDKHKRPNDLASAIAALEMAANASGVHVPPPSSSSDDRVLVPLTAPRNAAMLADPALSATLPSDVRSSVDRIVETKKPRRAPWIALAVFAGVFGGGAIAAAVSTSHTVAAAAPSPVPVATVAHVEPAPSLTVEISVRANEGAKIVGPGGVLLGTSPATITLPRGTAPIALELMMDGYASETLSVVPDNDRVLGAELKPVAPALSPAKEPALSPAKKPALSPAKKPAKPAPAPAPVKKKAGIDDLESFDG